ncbi:MAG: ATP-binding protein [Acidobacteriia bacterium]|nr:ATP-binding protein [Terriglobia bacterium]MBV8906664.1 ATP-binding protein [Terriglobia bacterium]
MAQDLSGGLPEAPIVIPVTWQGDVREACDSARKMAQAIGFPQAHAEEIVLAVNELGTNLLTHASGGSIKLTPALNQTRAGIQIEADDGGPGIADIELAMTDGYSTAGGLGIGLGTINRLMDQLEIRSQMRSGTHIVCQRWLRPKPAGDSKGELDFGVATRAYREMAENGDAFVLKQWEDSALSGLIDGLGHGQFAQRAAQTARHYIEQHFDQPLDNLFRGVGRACRATRGVVMALARFDLRQQRLNVASVGNIELRLFGNPQRFSPIVRRGIIGLNAPSPICLDHPWTSGSVLVLHTDGLRTHWSAEDFPEILRSPASIGANRLLAALGKREDDATVVVVRSKPQ